MGLDKFRNLILTAREDHHQDSPNYTGGDAKIHFDISGYNILFWDPNNLNKFKEDLEKRVKYRLPTSTPPISKAFKLVSYWGKESWISEHRKLALSGFKKCGKSGFMEINFTLPDFDLNIAQGKLLHVAKQAQILKFGWPLGVVINKAEYRPIPKTDSIITKIYNKNRGSYDYWAIRKDGTFYLLKSLFEDINNQQYIFFDTRIVRITEALLYSIRLYSGFKIPIDSRILIGIKHGGLENRIISRADGRNLLDFQYISQEDEVNTKVDTTFEKIKSDLVELIQEFIQQLFVIFDFFEVDRGIIENIVNNYLEGIVI